MELTGAPLLEVRSLEVRYGAQPALGDVSFDVDGGEILAVLGDNGAGRSTLLRCLAGVVPASAGTVHWRGEPVTHLTTARRVDLGVVMVAGTAAVFPSLTVADNLLTGCHRFAWDRQRVESRVDAALTLFAPLAERLDQTAGSLSGGEQQMLAIAKALVAEPALLLIDEPSLGLAPAAVADLAAALVALRADGLTMVVVEQRPHAAAAFATRAVWLDRGAVRFDGPIAELEAARRR